MKELIFVQPCKCKQNVFAKQFEFSFSEHIAKLNNDISRSLIKGVYKYFSCLYVKKRNCCQDLVIFSHILRNLDETQLSPVLPFLVYLYINSLTAEIFNKKILLPPFVNMTVHISISFKDTIISKDCKEKPQLLIFFGESKTFFT